MKELDEVLRVAVERGISDVHLTPGRPPMFRQDGALVPMDDDILRPEDIEKMVHPLMTKHAEEELKEYGEADFAYSLIGKGRYRVNAFRQRGTLAAAFRILPFTIPDPKTLQIPESVMEMVDKKRGLVLVTGATGSGKSTTLAAMINAINMKYPKHIITLEDPIEYLHRHNKCIVNQREVGFDTKSYAHALRAALREDPDVVLLGEMRDLETISTAITAAETGHLVLSTLHTNNAASTIDRIVDVFPSYQQQQIRIQLAGVLECVVSQQLIPKQDGKGRAAAFEVMLTNAAIKNLIRENKSFQIPSTIQTNRKNGMQLMDDAIYDLYMRNTIDGDNAVAFSADPATMMRKVTF